MAKRTPSVIENVFGRRPARGQTKDELHVEIMKGLLAMQKAGLLRSIHTHPLRIEIQDDPGALWPIDWTIAGKIVDKWRKGQVVPFPARGAQAKAKAQCRG